MVQCGGSNVMLPALASANFVGRCGQMIFPFVDPLENADGFHMFHAPLTLSGPAWPI